EGGTRISDGLCGERVEEGHPPRDLAPVEDGLASIGERLQGVEDLAEQLEAELEQERQWVEVCHAEGQSEVAAASQEIAEARARRGAWATGGPGTKEFSPLPQVPLWGNILAEKSLTVTRTTTLGEGIPPPPTVGGEGGELSQRLGTTEAGGAAAPLEARHHGGGEDEQLEGRDTEELVAATAGELREARVLLASIEEHFVRATSESPLQGESLRIQANNSKTRNNAHSMEKNPNHHNSELTATGAAPVTEYRNTPCLWNTMKEDKESCR
ncbi:unnamed protein product, partial [Discosporangium mesarthrocarpum]